MLHYSPLIKAALSSEDVAYLDAARTFASQYLQEEDICAWMENGGMPDKVMHAYHDSRLGHLGIPSEKDPGASSLLTEVLVIEELTRRAGTVLPFQRQLDVFSLLAKYASKEQMQPILDEYERTARMCASLAFTDALIGSDLRSYRTRIENVDGRLMLNGVKSFADGGMSSLYFIVLARDMTHSEDASSAPFTLFLVPRDVPGISYYPINKIGQRLVPTCAIEFADVQIDPSWQLSPESFTLEECHDFFWHTRCLVCATDLGLAQGAMDDAVHFAKNHTRRGVPIIKLQQIAEKLARMQTSIANMRHLTYNAALSIDQRAESVAIDASLMKQFVPDESVKVADAAMQVLGGVGYTDSSRTGRIWVDTRGGQFAAGTDEIMNLLVAKQIERIYP